jgi:hypothetical protein
VVAESFGGHRDYRLLRGVVCDLCNKGVLKQIDDAASLHPVLVSRRFLYRNQEQELMPGVRKDGTRSDVITIDPSKRPLHEQINLRFQFERSRGAGGVLRAKTSGPSPKIRDGHLGRALHRWAYNGIADAACKAGNRPRDVLVEYGHVRTYVLASVEDVTMRAFLLDERTLSDNIASPQPEATCELLAGPDGKPQMALIRSGFLFSYVSLMPTTHPLNDLKKDCPWLRVFGEIDVS